MYIRTYLDILKYIILLYKLPEVTSEPLADDKDPKNVI